MNCCSEWRERVALAAGGDLEPAERSAVDRHTAACAPCAEMLAGLEQALGLLHEAHAEPIADAHFAAVRARVLAQIDARRRRRWLWAAAFTTAAVLLALFSYKPAPIPRPPLVAVAAPPAPPLAQRPNRSLTVAAPVKRHAVTRAASLSKRYLPPPEPITVKLITDDPDVVIYWLGDPK